MPVAFDCVCVHNIYITPWCSKSESTTKLLFHALRVTHKYPPDPASLSISRPCTACILLHHSWTAVHHQYQCLYWVCQMYNILPWLYHLFLMQWIWSGLLIACRSSVMFAICHTYCIQYNTSFWTMHSNRHQHAGLCYFCAHWEGTTTIRVLLCCSKLLAVSVNSSGILTCTVNKSNTLYKHLFWR